MSERTKAENKAAMAEHLIGQYEARAASELAAPHGSAIAHDPELCAARLAACGDAAAEVVLAAQEAEKWKTECGRLLAENMQLRQALDTFQREALIEQLAETCQADDKPCEGCQQGGVCDGSPNAPAHRPGANTPTQ